MKLLLTVDLHHRRPWFDWLLGQARRYDLIGIAGDLLDMFSDAPRPAQADDVQRFLRKLAAMTRVVVCSGNHDAIGPVVPPMRGPVSRWLAELDSVRELISDGRTEAVGELVVTTVPYDADPEEKAVRLDRGHRVRAQRGGKWLVLHHEPPVTAGSATEGSAQGLDLVERYGPDFWLSGHVHDLPERLGGTWRHQVGATVVLTPGQRLWALRPNHVVVDLETNVVTWGIT
jgi:Icc-related predicted phosphoesterase